MLLTILLTVCWAKIKGHEVKRIFYEKTLIPYALVEIVFIVFTVLVFAGERSIITPANASLLKTFFILSMLAPILVYKLYLPATVGSVFVLTGTLLNQIVIRANGGRMPVFPSISNYTMYYLTNSMPPKDAVHMNGSADVKLKFLTDYIDVGYSILSLGDVLIHIFAGIIVFYTIKHINEVNNLGKYKNLKAN